ncbi:MAG: SCO family protein [Anaerolineales bacterium]|nr:SCO family protein [Anaerolineales bacterium]
MDRKTLLVGLAVFLLIGLTIVGVTVFGKPDLFRGTTYGEPYPVAPEFTLVQENGTSLQLSAMRGKIVILFFGYTSCPDVCPTTLAELNQALGLLSKDDAEQVQVVFVTVDPQRDTPQRVQEYVNHFNSSFIGLSGTEDELSKTWKAYGVFREVVDSPSAAGYLVNHTARTTTIDRDGHMRVSYIFGTPVDDIVHDLNLLLQEGK